MGLRINTNVIALKAQRNLGMNVRALQRAMERLSSGSRINNAGDDAAGLAVSEGLKSEIRGFQQAIRNSNDGVGFLATAEGALSESTNITQRIRELAIEAANGSISDNDRTNLNHEVQALISEFDQIATTTEFNGVFLLDGSFTTTNLQVGINEGDTISFTIGNARSAALGSLATISGARGQLTSAITGVFINGQPINASQATDDTASTSGNSYSAIAIAKNINLQQGPTTVQAVVETTIVQGNNMSFSNYQGNLSVDSFEINSIGITGTGINNVAAFITAVNNYSNQTGVQARLQANATSSIELYANDGRNINISWAGATASTYMYGCWDYAGSSNSTTTSGVTGISASLIFSAATSTALFSSGATNLVRTGAIQLQSSSAITITSTESAALGFTSTSISVSNTTALSNVTVSTQANASNALAILDSVLTQIVNLRASLGAVENRLDYNSSSLGIVNENLSAANSQVRDTDIALETADLTKAQILQQAGIAVLGQANISAQAALSLLKF